MLFLPFILVFLSTKIFDFSNGSDAEQKLLRDLFANYNPLIRPSRNATSKLTVRFGCALIQLISVEEKDQIMKTNSWLRMTWEDYQLKWDPKNYGGITVFRVESQKVWLPDIVLFNNADGNYEISYKSRVLVSSDGTQSWIPPTIYKSSCTIDVTYFPFDEQECELKYGSWTFNADELDFDWYSGPVIDLNDYVASGTWTLVDVPGKIVREAGTKTRAAKSLVVFKVRVRRKTLFYTVNLLTPCILISLLSVLVFYLPAIACEKITLSISILIALVVFILLLQKQLPPSPVLPLLANYLLFTFALNIFSIILTVIITNWSFRTPRTHYMPRWVKIFLLGYIPKILFMTRPNHDRWKKTLHDDAQSLGGSKENLGSIIEYESPEKNADENKCDNPYCKALINPYSKSVLNASKAVTFIADHLKDADKYECTIEDWNYAGIVLDRLMLILFLTVTVAGTLKIIFDNPNMFNPVDEENVKQHVKTIITQWEEHG